MFKINDRFTRGYIAGMAGAIPQGCFTLTLHGLHMSRFRYLDFASTLVFNHLPKGLFESIVAELIVVIFSGLLGSIFSLSIKLISGKYLGFKGFLAGILSWFFIYSMITAFKIRPIFPLDTSTAVFQLIGGIIWGISMAAVYSYFESKSPLKD